MSIHLRGEMPGDEGKIDIVNCRAFRGMSEPNLVRAMRSSYPLFDARFSITAWDGDEMVGHTLFSPLNMRFMGRSISAVEVAPVAVVPERQRQGIGGMMMRYGHDLARREGFQLSILQGIPSYYPQHGYKPCYGFATVKIDVDALPSAEQKLIPLPVHPADLPWISTAYANEWQDVDFSWQRGMNMNEWAMLGVNAVVWWTEDRRRAAYVAKVRDRIQVIGDNPELVRDVIATVRPGNLDQHPSGWLAQNALDAKWSKAEVEIHPAAMVCELEEGLLQPYLDALEKGERLPGSCNWSILLALC